MTSPVTADSSFAASGSVSPMPGSDEADRRLCMPGALMRKEQQAADGASCRKRTYAAASGGY